MQAFGASPHSAIRSASISLLIPFSDSCWALIERSTCESGTISTSRGLFLCFFLGGCSLPRLMPRVSPRGLGSAPERHEAGVPNSQRERRRGEYESPVKCVGTLRRPGRGRSYV